MPINFNALEDTYNEETLDILRNQYHPTNRPIVWDNTVAQCDIILDGVMADTCPGEYNLTLNQLQGIGEVTIELNYNCYPCRINNVEVSENTNFNYGDFANNFMNKIGVFVAEAVRFTGLESVLQGNQQLNINVMQPILLWEQAVRVRQALLMMPSKTFTNRWQQIVGANADSLGNICAITNIIRNWRALTLAWTEYRPNVAIDNATGEAYAALTRLLAVPAMVQIG